MWKAQGRCIPACRLGRASSSGDGGLSQELGGTRPTPSAEPGPSTVVPPPPFLRKPVGGAGPGRPSNRTGRSPASPMLVPRPRARAGSVPGGWTVYTEEGAPENKPDEAGPGTRLALGRLSAAEVTLTTGPAALHPLGQSRETGRERKPDSPQSPRAPRGPASGGRPRGDLCPTSKSQAHTGCGSLGLPTTHCPLPPQLGDVCGPPTSQGTHAHPSWGLRRPDPGPRPPRTLPSPPGGDRSHHHRLGPVVVTEILRARPWLKDGQNLCPEKPPGSLGTSRNCGGARGSRAGVACEQRAVRGPPPSRRTGRPCPQGCGS